MKETGVLCIQSGCVRQHQQRTHLEETMRLASERGFSENDPSCKSSVRSKWSDAGFLKCSKIVQAESSGRCCETCDAGLI